MRDGQIDVGIVGMRVDARTRSAEQLQRFIDGLKLPLLSYLRNTQNYVQLAAHGLTLWDVAASRVQRDIDQWQAIISWLDGAAVATAQANKKTANQAANQASSSAAEID